MERVFGSVTLPGHPVPYQVVVGDSASHGLLRPDPPVVVFVGYCILWHQVVFLQPSRHTRLGIS